jgi:hypothetical protein
MWQMANFIYVVTRKLPGRPVGSEENDAKTPRVRPFSSPVFLLIYHLCRFGGGPDRTVLEAGCAT